MSQDTFPVYTPQEYSESSRDFHFQRKVVFHCNIMPDYVKLSMPTEKNKHIGNQFTFWNHTQTKQK